MKNIQLVENTDESMTINYTDEECNVRQVIFAKKDVQETISEIIMTLGKALNKKSFLKN